MSTKPEQESRRPQLFIGDVVPELVGEVEPQLAESVVQGKWNRRLNEARTNGRLIRQAPYIGQSPLQPVTLGEQQLEGFCGDVIPRHPAASVGLYRQFYPPCVGVQDVWYQVTAQPTPGSAATEWFEAML